MHLSTLCVDLDKPDPPRQDTQAGASAPQILDDPERRAMLATLKEQIRQGVYRPDVRDLARSLASMMVRDL